MADPRGRGFNRNKGSWHQHTPITIALEENPEQLGWTAVNGGSTFTLDGYELLRKRSCWVINRPDGHGQMCPSGYLVQETQKILEQMDSIPFMGEPVPSDSDEDDVGLQPPF